MGMGTVEPPLQVDAEVFHREMKTGRNGAVLLQASTPLGAPVDVVVKPAARLKGYAPVPYLVEWLASAIGRHLGIKVPEPMAVRISREFATSLDQPIRSVMMQSTGTAFGCRFYPAPFLQWTNGELLPMDLRQAAAETIAFDVFVHNPDRRRENPNVFTSRQEILALDHDQAFSFIVPLLGEQTDPAEDPLIASVLERHVFSKLFGRKVPDLQRFRSAVMDLTDEVLEEIARITPGAWQEGPAAGKLQKIVGVVRRRRDSIDRWLPQVEAWIAK